MESHSLILVPKIPEEHKCTHTYSPAVAKRSTFCKNKKVELDQHSQALLNEGYLTNKLGLINCQEGYQEGKNLFQKYDDLGMLAVYFNNEEEKETLKQNLEDDYDFLPNITLSVPETTIGDGRFEEGLAPRENWPEDSGIAKARLLNLEGEGVLVGVIDSGIDVDHSEFFGKLINFRYFYPDPESLATKPLSPRVVRGFDTRGHGTNICGIIAGNKIGIAPKADLYVASVMNREWLTTSLNQFINSLNWLFSEFTNDSKNNTSKPAIINISMGYSLQNNVNNAGLLAQIRDKIIKLIVDANVLPIAAIGNTPGNFLYPAAYPEVLGIGSVKLDVSQKKYQLSSLSGFGKPTEGNPKPDLVGFGEDIRTCFERTIDNRQIYINTSGTSISSPYVTGIAALYRCQDNSLTVDEVRNKILQNVLPLSHLSQETIGKGLVRFLP